MADQTNKRARSPSGDGQPHPPAKIPKSQTNHLQINYLSRQYSENIPLVAPDTTLPQILQLIANYDGVLQRHESIASNLGACPLGPILVKRFERLFDGPPKVLKTNGKDGSVVTWLDVVEFARTKPEQFNLEKMRNGVRVCQFYTKQCRVEISEEDYVVIASGMPQKLIPPQPIQEDEEKELGALDILDKNLVQIILLSDQVSARARQLNHRLKNRRSAIIQRREGGLQQAPQMQPQLTRSISPPSRQASSNGYTHVDRNGMQASPHMGFVAVNTRQDAGELPQPQLPSHDSVTILNGQSIKGASPTTRAEMMKQFFAAEDERANRQMVSDEHSIFNQHHTVAIPNTPTTLIPPQAKSTTSDKDDGGPYKAEMVARMEQMARGERIMPPCDRCRRLHMDCLKNLSACAGCTKKHARCSWKDVTAEESEAARKELAQRAEHVRANAETSPHAASPGQVSDSLPDGLAAVANAASAMTTTNQQAEELVSQSLTLPPIVSPSHGSDSREERRPSNGSRPEHVYHENSHFSAHIPENGHSPNPSSQNAHGHSFPTLPPLGPPTSNASHHHLPAFSAQMRSPQQQHSPLSHSHAQYSQSQPPQQQQRSPPQSTYSHIPPRPPSTNNTHPHTHHHHIQHQHHIQRHRSSNTSPRGNSNGNGNGNNMTHDSDEEGDRLARIVEETRARSVSQSQQGQGQGK